MADYVGEIVMRCGDQLPSLDVAIEDDQGNPVDVSAASHVEMILTHEDGRDPRVVPGNPRMTALVLPGMVLNGPTGIVGYDWQPADALRPGVIQLVVVAYLLSGTISAPSDRSARIIVRPDTLDIFGGTVPGRYDLNLYRGDTKTWVLRLWGDEGQTVPIDLTGATAVAEIRNKPGGAIVVPLICGITLPNHVAVTLEAEDAKHVPAHGVWDLEIHYPAQTLIGADWVNTVVNGTVTCTPDVTGSLFTSIEEVSRV